MRIMRLLRREGLLAMTTSVILLLSVVAQAQILKPVKWSFTSVKKSAGLYELHMTAVIDKNLKIYSGGTPDGGPLPTKVTFEKNPLIMIGGKVKEVGDVKKVHEPAFGDDVLYYKDKVDFVQVVKMKKGIASSAAPSLAMTGSMEFMAYDESQCLPPE